MVARFDSEEAIADIVFLADKLNVLLPKDIAVIRIEAVTPEAHARFSATSRTYQYQITDKRILFRYGEVYRMHHLPDIDAMNDAAQGAVSSYDFRQLQQTAYRYKDQLLPYHANRNGIQEVISASLPFRPIGLYGTWCEIVNVLDVGRES